MTARTTARTRTALVIGGGIAGPVAAMALHKAGIEATVYEAYDSTGHPAPSLSSGGGMTIAPNGQQALEAIDAAETVRAIGTPVTALGLRSWTGRHLARLAPPEHLPTTRFVWRTELHEALAAEATRRGIPIQRGKRLLDATDTGTGVTARFSDGSLAKADVLIGADGLRSTVRSLIAPTAPKPHYAGMLTFTAHVQKTELPSTEGVLYMCYGKRAYFAYQIRDDASAVWTVNLPHREPMTSAEAQAVGAVEWLRRLAQTFTDDRTPAADLVAATAPEDLLITGPTETMPPLTTWSRGRMTLIGDAAHATPPTSGQGASLASESAVQLARCLRDLPPGKAFSAYESLRRPRVDRILKHTTATPTATSAAARTATPKPAGPLSRVLRDALLPVATKVGGAGGAVWGAWQFDHPIDWEERVE
ncbi:FAD-dependent oxidoreductase [Streptomyces longisporoflavus]|uniref:FAD-dependent oxidoreductase n=1 Tax=Streptomyces longisporoflavus TaxID=28044 RepID=UPI00167D143E|nr:NAD(P)/FAD-dependent oxidoreductase [Streptomyces longisporoflavus]GGV31569.1 FAD-dependent oxidoreductase [Streptomyces longisporoflavus]